MERPQFEREPQAHQTNQAAEGLIDQSFFDTQDELSDEVLEEHEEWWNDEDEENNLLDLARAQNGFYVKPRAERTREELNLKEAYGVWPDNLPEGWENFLKDPDEDPDAWDLPDSYFE